MTACPAYKPPFPYFGGKARIADEVWRRFGDCGNYVEPFFGSGAVLFRRPVPFRGVETVNDADGLVANFWRAVQADAEAVAFHADWPVTENDLSARHAWLVARKDLLQERLEGDPDYFDAKIAGWWAWGLSAWIGGDWCSGKGPWHVVEDDEGFPVLRKTGSAGQGVSRRRPDLGPLRGVDRPNQDLLAYMGSLSARLRRVRVVCGDWNRVAGVVPMCEGRPGNHPIAVFLDPPYAAEADRADGCYRVDSLAVAHDVRRWAIEHGDDPRYRIATCGFEGEHEMPDSWECIQGKAGGTGIGMGANAKDGYANRGRERVWFSPHCLRLGAESMPLLRFNA